MSESAESSHERASTSAVGVILIVAITVILASVIGVTALGIGADLLAEPTFAALDVDFEEAPASEPNYAAFRWEVTLTNNGGDTVDAEDIVVYLDHGNQRVTGTLDRSLAGGETVELILVHNNQNGSTIPDDVNCTDVNVACRLAGDETHYPDSDQIRLQMIDRGSESILYREQIGISGAYGIFNGKDVSITNETLTFA